MGGTMVLNAKDKTSEIRENMRGGNGSVQLESFLPSGELPKGYRLFSELTLEQGCSIGKHMHQKESEIFYILSGEAVVDDNGKEVTLFPGDVAICYSGQSHSIRNEKAEKLKLIAVIVVE
jgi:mannose-6-phosphate isomerase-like protein (cupin superfamily)